MPEVGGDDTGEVYEGKELVSEGGGGETVSARGVAARCAVADAVVAVTTAAAAGTGAGMAVKDVLLSLS